MKPIVIIGSGLAGYGVAREFRKLNSETPLLIVTADDGKAYSKPMLSNALGKGKTIDQLATSSSIDMAKQLVAEIRTHTRVSAIDPRSHEILVDNEKIKYSKLVLALGATPFQPPLDGNAANKVYTINNLNDYSKFRSAIENKKTITILGGGLIGCEFANDLAANGYSVNIIDRNSWPLGRLIPQEVGEKLQQSLEKIGVNWYNGNTVTRVEHSDGKLTAELEDGEKLSTDIVLSAIGLRAELSLAQQAGLKTDRGVVVDNTLESSSKDIFALGDCAEVNGQFLPFIMPLMKCSRALAQTLNNNTTPVSYPPMPVSLKTPSYPVSLLPPPANIAGQWGITKEDDGISALYKNNDNQLLGFVLSDNKVKEANKLAQSLEN